jgi:hypothetical protein|tara:strand:+ start:1689 stop:1838 length:150 start_codon:yes stop_codon:yes gene_type:complete
MYSVVGNYKRKPEQCKEKVASQEEISTRGKGQSAAKINLYLADRCPFLL